MKMVRKMIKGGALAAACMLLFLAAVPREALGADAIDTSKSDCSMEFSLGSNYTGELNGLPVPVTIYKIADVTASGAYKPDKEYQDIGLQNVSSSTTAEQWQAMAEKAAQTALPEGVLSEVEVSEGEPKKLFVGEKPNDLEERTVLTDGTGTIPNLTTGMYLVLAFAVSSEQYTYYFAPYLVSVPGNDYYTTGSDSWIYDVEVTLKPASVRRWGYLRIIKNLQTYREGDTASFIFQVEGTKAADTVQAEEYKYSNVLQYRFDGPGTQNDLLIKLPAGTTGTVTEVGPGAGYRNTGAATQDFTIAAGDENSAQVATVTFTNEYDGGMNGGTSVVNRFTPESNGTLPSTSGQNETNTVSLLSDEPVDPDSIVWDWTQE